MRKFALLAMVLLGLILPGQALAQGFKTPEEAITAYVQAISKRDFKGALAATAVGQFGKSFDFVPTVEWLKAFYLNLYSPATDPFYAEINDTLLAGQFASEIKFLVYGLMTTGDIMDHKAVPMDAAAATDFMLVIDAKRLAGLSIAAIGIPRPATLNSERRQLQAKKSARRNGAETTTERVVLLSFEGLSFMIGFELLRYGDEWMILSQSSDLANASSFAAPRRMTPDEFRVLVQ